MRVAQGAAIGHVKAPYPYSCAGGRQGPGFSRSCQIRLAGPARLAVEADLDIVQTYARSDCHAIPLVETAMRYLVAQLVERQRRELLVGALGLLHGQHVDLGALQPVE